MFYLMHEGQIGLGSIAELISFYHILDPYICLTYNQEIITELYPRPQAAGPDRWTGLSPR